MSYLLVSDLSLNNAKALVRVGFDVPLDENGKITDLSRIQESLPTLNYILEKGGSIILLSHLGRPKGAKNPKYSLKICQEALSSLLERPVLFADDCLGNTTRQQFKSLKPGEILLLENLRFYPGEEHPESDPSFAQTLASYGNVYIDDAFSTAHRNHASVVDLPKFFPSEAAVGFLMEKEITALNKLMINTQLPFHLILGGAKVSSKIGVLTALIPKVQAIYIGGAMAFTFLHALGIDIGDSLYEPEQTETAKRILEDCKKRNVPVFLPSDSIVSNGRSSKIIFLKNGIEKGFQGMDIGPETIETWEKNLLKANSVFWNGPLGVFENPSFAKGTFSVAECLASLSSIRIVGGGDSTAAINILDLADKFTHISTGGGASLEFLEKGSLPGIDALSLR